MGGHVLQNWITVCKKAGKEWKNFILANRVHPKLHSREPESNR
jgi:hypothetical protein